ncbi:MAG: PQQ-binding-like beta-propeller repeat protein [Verrucomicrobiales bacterium]|nr:PQQ-binding-like beta-propeller repeat protein [Verrucomicrobiales bacterium]
MSERSLILILLCLVAATSGLAGANDWRLWRGGNGNGIASNAAVPPAGWGEDLNIKWRSVIPGRGHASPIVVDDLVVIATATDDTQLAIAYDRRDGSVRWRKTVHEGGVPTDLHRKNTAASSTPASDGKHFYFLFHHRGSLFLSALNRSGSLLWQREAGGFVCHYGFGYGASPTLYEDLIIITSEYEEGFIAAFSTKDGSEKWRVERKLKTSYSSPIVADVAGRDQLLLSGGGKVSSYDPATGALLWQVDGSSLATCGTMVWSEDTVFASGGFPNKETLAVRADGSGEVLWRNGDKSYEQSMLYYGKHLYTLNDNGIALCWDAETGEEKWKVRLGGPVSASPVLAGGLIYAMNEQGVTFAYKPNPDLFEKVGEYQLGDEGFATPVFVGREVFVRTAEHGSERQEYLYCVGE